eukprot:CAMPEP_0203683710 /NCGR_PEP_ID=MMETSP0090-20130426/47665_1 /ASSEMBLY_ACC=CAM_ASM_001088 /TAXON_ID=426623 /ORGANISM="Chaetoceros affinis, Strain CCMP159" /LENGTH=476 /DNA_ID=CAMNT_0050552865 /DNA_START=1348 /DNA_END=2778 /DNA_ORIENTATION=+
MYEHKVLKDLYTNDNRPALIQASVHGERSDTSSTSALSGDEESIPLFDDSTLESNDKDEGDDDDDDDYEGDGDDESVPSPDDETLETTSSDHNNKDDQQTVVHSESDPVLNNSNSNNNSNNPNDKFCVIHVGPHKTGSTSLQDFILEAPASKSALAKDHYWVPHFPEGIGQAVHEPGKNHAIFANCVRSSGSRNFCPTGRVRDQNLIYFRTFVKDAASTGSNIVLSSEEFDAMDVDVHELTSFFTQHHYKVHIVLYYRRFYDWVISWYNQLTKTGWNNGYIPFEQWCNMATLERYKKEHSIATYKHYMNGANGGGVFNVSVVNMHEDPDHYDSDMRFACDHLDNAPHSCELAKSKVSSHNNGSVDLTWKMFRHKLKNHHSIHLSQSDERWVQIETKFNQMTDFPLLCLPNNVQDRMLAISLEAEITLTPEWWYNSKEGLEHLKADFAEKIKSKFCTMDFATVLRSPEWQNFLTGLQ